MLGDARSPSGGGRTGASRRRAGRSPSGVCGSSSSAQTAPTSASTRVAGELGGHRRWRRRCGRRRRGAATASGSRSTSRSPSGRRSRPPHAAGRPALAGGLEAQHGARHPHVERLAAALHRDVDDAVEMRARARRAARRPRCPSTSATGRGQVGIGRSGLPAPTRCRDGAGRPRRALSRTVSGGAAARPPARGTAHRPRPARIWGCTHRPSRRSTLLRPPRPPRPSGGRCPGCRGRARRRTR